LQVYDFASKTVSFIAPANDLIVLNFCKGKHRDQLVLNQHRYFLGGGSYDWYWLFDRSGHKKIGPVADDKTKRQEVVQEAREMICGSD
jgi:hypothetical protein